MGFRTVVILYNDQASDWENDPTLGKQIAQAMHHVNDTSIFSKANFGYGKVVECTHADNETLAIVESYSYHPISHSNWFPGKLLPDIKLDFLKNLARDLGYRLHKILPRNNSTHGEVGHGG